jgi:hypothetical protein
MAATLDHLGARRNEPAAQLRARWRVSLYHAVIDVDAELVAAAAPSVTVVSTSQITWSIRLAVLYCIFVTYYM